MANRSMQAKMLKLKKQIRKLPKPYQHVYFTEGKTKDPRDYELDPDKSVYPVTTKYRVRARTLGEEEPPPAFPNCQPGRVEALAHLKRIRSAVPDMISFVLLKNSRLRTTLFRDSPQTIFVIMEEDLRSGRVFSSMTYSDRGRIISHWKNNTLRGVYINPKAGSSPSPA